MNIHSIDGQVLMTKVDKRKQIIRTALELIAEHGFHGAPMAMIADRAGVGAGTIYRYFESKDVLICDLYKEIEQRVTEVIAIGYSPDETVRERFIHLGSRMIRYFIDHPMEFRYVEQFHNSPYGAEHRKEKILGIDQGCNIFKLLLEEGITSGAIKDFHLAVLFALSFGPIISVIRDHILGFVQLDGVLVERIVSACWDGIKN